MKDIISCFPDTFIKFLSDNDVDTSLYDQVLVLPRYFRLSIINHGNQTTHDILDSIRKHVASQLGYAEDGRERIIEPVIGMEHLNFYKILPTSLPFNLASSWPFRTLNAFGMDISSALAVDLLNIQSSDHILDLCCAPGAKLSLISELYHSDRSGTITGVDINESRLQRVRNLCRKMRYRQVRLFLCDGTKFSIRPCDVIFPNKKKRKKSDDTVFYANMDYRNSVGCTSEYYDKVIVDVECTHDGSIQHLMKHISDDWVKIEDLFRKPDYLQNLESLQRSLILNGYRLLKPGGELLYSTCSFSPKQNENIVNWLIEETKNTNFPASYLDVPNHPFLIARRDMSITKTMQNPSISPRDTTSKYQSSILLSPRDTLTSGLFIARVFKSTCSNT